MNEKIHEKLIKNLSKINQKWTKNRSWGSLGASWGRLEDKMGAHRVRAGHPLAF